MSIDKPDNFYPVIIVGGGPVGLYLGCLLHKYDIPFVILEKRQERIQHSRSLGIHPVSLELFDELGIADRFVEKGIKIHRGIAFSENGRIGSIAFNDCPKPFNYILSLPQYITETILEEHLDSLNPDALFRGAEVTWIEESDNFVTVSLNLSGKPISIKCRCLVGCDGKESMVREQAGIAFEGVSYPDTYIMGDFSDNTNFDDDAAVFLPDQGLIESFPLINNRRRWVVKTKEYIENVSRSDLEKRVAARIGYELSETDNYMLSSFGVQRLIAKPMARSRIALAGDAAHVVSPIGGQGMNLGWLDAAELAKHLESSLANEDDEALFQKLETYARHRQKITAKVIRRAEINMKLGRKSKLPYLRNTLVWLMLNTPLKRSVARLFTMRNLENGFL
ncbi:FAD-dependent monooxygenase [Balneolaceae bacterium YR4-1]|uniref:FAD-dependent monooxygenase n=1 Tax=Halalkalibaculum roseum TaxID=2709311 RepID=A0A6M1T1X8_9BACT|nr:NAD(P)/FAD-dependent oxidoreductase [Halalkalibaculum roseum]NGP78126.1 FAD-dependent monooxygenase [Halalkalibaculum roseum]